MNPLIELLAYDDNEEIQCHAISTLRNLAASSERNKRAIVEAGAVERIKTLINKVPASVQTEMTAAIAVLALSDDLKQKLLGMGILEVLVELTSSSNMEVEGNSAAAIGNLSSKGKPLHEFWLSLHCELLNPFFLTTVKDYTPFVKAWNLPFGGLEKFLIQFLSEEQDIAFQHIGVWTIEQFLDGGDERLLNLIANSETITESIKRIINEGQKPKMEVGEEDADDGDIFALAKRVYNTLQQIRESNGASQKKQR